MSSIMEVANGENKQTETPVENGRRSPEAMAMPQSNSLPPSYFVLPPQMFLNPNEYLGGYIFMCNDYALPEFLRRQIFCLPANFRASVNRIRPGTLIFLYNYSTRRLHGVFEATSYGGFNIEPYAWPIINLVHQSFYPAQVHIRWSWGFLPLPLETSNQIMELLRVGEYPADKFRVELRYSEAHYIKSIFHANETAGYM